jgi:hypothetical protein
MCGSPIVMPRRPATAANASFASPISCGDAQYAIDAGDTGFAPGFHNVQRQLSWPVVLPHQRMFPSHRALPHQMCSRCLIALRPNPRGGSMALSSSRSRSRTACKASSVAEALSASGMPPPRRIVCLERDELGDCGSPTLRPAAAASGRIGAGSWRKRVAADTQPAGECDRMPGSIECLALGAGERPITAVVMGRILTDIPRIAGCCRAAGGQNRQSDRAEALKRAALLASLMRRRTVSSLTLS